MTSIYESAVTKGKVLFTWCIPVNDNNNKFIGVILADIFVDSISSILKNVKPFEGTEILFMMMLVILSMMGKMKIIY